MQLIKKYAEEIAEELESAKEYAEKFVEYRVKGDMQIASQFKEMTLDELRHATFLHTQAVKEIEALSKIYTPPVEMAEKWEKLHKEYVEKYSWIKKMLEM
jgi:hypothetical protein